MSDIDIALTLFGGLALTLGLLARWLKRNFVSENALALLAGVLIGPVALDLIDVSRWGNQETILKHVAHIALAIALMEIALRLPKQEFIRNLHSYAVLLGTVMPLMWITTGLVTWLILDLPIWVALLIAAILTPTDPIVASSIVTGPIAERFLPSRIRDTLWAESGANDGMAHPLVMLSILALGSSFSEVVGDWIVSTLLYEIGVAVLIGAALGFAASRLLRWAENWHTIEHQSFRTFTLALSLTALGVSSLANAKGLLAVFVTGMIFHLSISEEEDRDFESVQVAIDHVFTIPMFALIGITIPLQGWINLGWSAVFLPIAILVLRRLPAIILVSPLIRTLRSWPDVLFVGWFGPLGVGAFYYAAFVLGETGYEQVWVVATLVISVSIIVHGLTATPFTYLYDRYSSNEQDERAHPSSESNPLT